MSVPQPLRLPEGYDLELQRGDPDYLVLKRGDGTPLAAFEFSAIGPDPAQIMQMAWDDAEYRQRF